MMETKLTKAIALIAKGLVEKDEQIKKQPNRYPYSRIFQHGINMFASAAVELGAVTPQKMAQLTEAVFLRDYATKSVCEWFDSWNKEILKKLNIEDELFYNYGAFVYEKEQNSNQYGICEECDEFLCTQEADIIAGTDERHLYEKMIVLSQEYYCKVRKFIIEHPCIKAQELRSIKQELFDSEEALAAIQFAYEQFYEDMYRCPTCGWTMTSGKYGARCYSRHCIDTKPQLENAEHLNGSKEPIFRLKRGIMQFVAAPGKLEVDIASACEKLGLDY